MSYCTGKDIEIARGKAIKLLKIEHLPVQIVADRFGVNRSTIWRWHKKWQEQNKNVQLYNTNRSQNNSPSVFRMYAISWNVPTLSSAPNNPHTLPEELVRLVLDVAEELKRCAEAVWHYINQILCIRISLSSVRRILKKYHRSIPRSHRNKDFKDIKRPKVLMPGDLVEIDTIHLYNPVTKGRRYLYTVIDLYTRMSYARAYNELAPGHSVNTIKEAEEYFWL